MAKYKLLLPKMGESVAEATVIKWTKNPGDYIEADETVMEIATDKVDSDVPSPVAGKLIEQFFKDNDVVQVGAIIAIIETNEPEEEVKGPSLQHESVVAETPKPVEEVHQPIIEPFATDSTNASEAIVPPVFEDYRSDFAQAVPYIDQIEQTNVPGVESAAKNSLRFYSPLVKNIAAQEGISSVELDQITGTGAEGRLTKDDLLAYIQNRFKPNPSFENNPVKAEPVLANTIEAPKSEPVVEKSQPVIETPAPVTEVPKVTPAAQSEPVPVAKSVSGEDEIIEMDRMRRIIADHMVMSKHTSPHVTSFVEADVTNIVLWREKIKSSFEKREGEKITFTPIFIEAVVRAIKDLPMINIQVNGTQIIKKKDINISMATALPNGNLIVPVIKKADELSLIGLTKAVNDLASRARTNKLKPDDVQGGTFTITNVGSFGNVMGTPIINQPQVAILAVGAIKKKPAVIETLQGDMIAIRHMMFLSLSYDHRVVDGSLGGSFVRRVADYLENWDPGREL
ncbi:2-oxoglutarate dehydrogenase E2 component (dihydrolipoamide succinyltransferase) [Mucilaginibacter frigoritolerans]|uniref:Dihydrolipoamide acetyltransferase component of pyruvate dehydrogenase complex n=1 Tax=Mucilaginibacter frigoritolerans TaxID=652788 RepID=A0A562UGI5_9SPHI|nr:dihydrolipoamide acetyltransferase family protein [Mucilaginibacter frigoritolerans]TWJ04934.1 2-oxoglutarate dehydrogenase E2 component (dihydrolipoamide succinyltransferase) [Mucilaginibacter frigoritolerans]